jgi:hypothetical protein
MPIRVVADGSGDFLRMGVSYLRRVRLAGAGPILRIQHEAASIGAGRTREMSTSRDRYPALSRLRPLAVALALAGTPGVLHAVVGYGPGTMLTAGDLTREDGIPLRVALRAWHQAALNNAVPPSPTAIIRPVANCDDDGEGSLRAVLAATASGDTVDLSGLACSSISLVTGAVAARVDTVTLNGPAGRELTIDGNDIDRVLLHYGAGTFTVRNLTVAHGRHVATGTDVGIAGCIASAGYLTLDHSKVTDCYAAGEGAYGGGIYAYSLIMASSTLSRSTAYGTHPTNNMAAFGGGAFVYQLDLVDSTLTGNSALHRANPPRTSYDIGGGVCTVRGGLVIDSTIDTNYTQGRGGGLATFSSILVRNSTISGNVARTFGGGGLFIRSPSVLDARNSTITNNSGHNGGGVLTSSRNASLLSTILAGNVADASYFADLASSRDLVIAGSNDLIGESSANITIPADNVREDPGLLPLAYNGGLTRTHALRGDSPGIDAGNNVTQLASDQRGAGYPRVVGAAADIGAFEFNGTTTFATVQSVPTLTAWATALLLAMLSLAGARSLTTRGRKQSSRLHECHRQPQSGRAP